MKTLQEHGIDVGELHQVGRSDSYAVEFKPRSENTREDRYRLVDDARMVPIDVQPIEDSSLDGMAGRVQALINSELDFEMSEGAAPLDPDSFTTSIVESAPSDDLDFRMSPEAASASMRKSFDRWLFAFHRRNYSPLGIRRNIAESAMSAGGVAIVDDSYVDRRVSDLDAVLPGPDAATLYGVDTGESFGDVGVPLNRSASSRFRTGEGDDDHVQEEEERRQGSDRVGYQEFFSNLSGKYARPDSFLGRLGDHESDSRVVIPGAKETGNFPVVFESGQHPAVVGSGVYGGVESLQKRLRRVMES